MKNYIIGDIHGCIEPLRKLLDVLAPDPAADRMILLGDLFDRGPDSWEVFQYVKKLAASFGDRFVLLRGNHEDYLLQEKLSFTQRLVWDRVGRGTTVRSFKQHGKKMEDAVPWMQEHTVMYYRGEGFQCVHAGLKIDPPELNDVYTMLHDHGVVLENKYSGPLTVTGHIALEKCAWFAGDGKTVKELAAVPAGEYDPAASSAASSSAVVSATAVSSTPVSATAASSAPVSVSTSGAWQLLPENGILCIDTGCGKGGRLTAMVIEDGKFFLCDTDESDVAVG